MAYKLQYFNKPLLKAADIDLIQVGSHKEIINSKLENASQG